MCHPGRTLSDSGGGTRAEGATREQESKGSGEPALCEVEWGSAFAFFTIPKANRVIPTEAAHSLIVSGAVEGPPHFAFAVVFVFVVAPVFALSFFVVILR
jgi:hypothetical protein